MPLQVAAAFPDRKDPLDLQELQVLRDPQVTMVLQDRKDQPAQADLKD
jgi:hypothetical protein